jgi:hypothetical protein
MSEEDGSSGINQEKGSKSRKGKYRLALIGLAVALVVLALVTACAIYLAGGTDSGKPVAGHPDWRILSLPIYYENGSTIEILENQRATDPSYGLMISFLSDYGAPPGEYGTGHVCSSYAVELYDSAERMGINAHMVLVYFVGVVDPHSILAFDTTDKGRVYIDPTGLTPQEQALGYPAQFRIADVTPGSPYRLHYTSPFNATVEDTGCLVDRISSLS